VSTYLADNHNLKSHTNERKTIPLLLHCKPWSRWSAAACPQTTGFYVDRSRSLWTGKTVC